jgi:hypothetical protein
MQKLVTGICILVLGAGVGAAVFWLSVRERLAAAPADAPAGEHGSDAAPAEAPRLSHTPEGETVVRFETETQERVGLKTEPLVAAARQAEVGAYGVLQEDPAQSFTLRAPVAGILRTDAGAKWPSINQYVEAGVVVGYIEPRLTQTERIDLASRLTQARADAAEAEAALTSAQTSYENKKKLNADSKLVSDRVLEEAHAKVKGEEARLSAALQIVHLIESAQASGGEPALRFELRTEQAGEVMDIPASLGEAVEAGQVLLRLVRFDALVARVEVPVGQPFDAAAKAARIVVVGDEERTLVGERIGLGENVSATPGGPTLLFRVPTAGLSVRPGAAVVAHLPVPGGMRDGVLIPRSAVIRLMGKAWTYVQSGEESFVRRALTGAEFVGDTWFVVGDFRAGDRVVTEGAQMLLSEELKAQIEREAAATE